MLSSIYSAKKREDGFTLIELLIVVIIIGILAAIALPIFIDQQKVAVDASVQSDVRNSVTNITNAQAQNDLTDVKAAISNAGTTLRLTAPAVGTADPIDSSATKTTGSKFAKVPALGSAYVLTGQNDGGKKFTATAGKAYTFTAASGQFSTADAPTAGGNSTSPSALNGDAVYPAAYAYNNTFAVSDGGDILPLTAAVKAAVPDLGALSDSKPSIILNPVSNLRFYNSAGVEVNTGWDLSACNVRDTFYSDAFLTSIGYPHTGDSAQAGLSCVFDADTVNAATASKLDNGYVKYDSTYGTSTVRIGSAIDYRG